MAPKDSFIIIENVGTFGIYRIKPFRVSLISADGRYDTPSHHLFRTLPTEHRDDFYQPCEPQIKANVGPRLPWQDIHAKIEGPAARDVMINFVERYEVNASCKTFLITHY